MTTDTEAPKPVARPRRIDIEPARSRPLTSVAIMVAGRDRAFRYSACSDEQSWSGTLDAESVETAILDVMKHVRAESDSERLRFLVQVPPRSTLWALRDEIALLMPGVYLERPRLSDEALVRAAVGCLLTERPAATGPVVVATDGSVRHKAIGCPRVTPPTARTAGRRGWSRGGR
jgi:hypothetical protein